LVPSTLFIFTYSSNQFSYWLQVYDNKFSIQCFVQCSFQTDACCQGVPLAGYTTRTITCRLNAANSFSR